VRLFAFSRRGIESLSHTWYCILAKNDVSMVAKGLEVYGSVGRTVNSKPYFVGFRCTCRVWLRVISAV
jgi:hypothetical protein